MISTQIFMRRYAQLLAKMGRSLCLLKYKQTIDESRKLRALGDRKNTEHGASDDPKAPAYWNIYTVLKHTINPGGRLPYLVIATHCHFDHILGIGLLPPTDSGPQHQNVDQRTGPITAVLSSAHNKSHISPWKQVYCHSPSKKFNTECLYYTIGIWAQDH